MEPSDKNEILIGITNNEVFIRAIGHITAKHSFIIRQYIYKTFLQLKRQIKLFFDLSGTEYMDSTFLGMIIGIDKKFARNKNVDLTVINPSEQAVILLNRAHMINFLKIETLKIPDDVILNKVNEDIEISDYEKLKILYDAHDELSLIDNENKNEYSKVKDVLKEELTKEKKKRKKK